MAQDVGGGTKVAIFGIFLLGALVLFGLSTALTAVPLIMWSAVILGFALLVMSFGVWVL